MVSESSRGSSSDTVSFRLCRLFAHGHNTCRRRNVADYSCPTVRREPAARCESTHLQQAVWTALLQEGLAGLVPPRVSAGHLQLQLPQLLHEDRQVSADGHQALQVVQAGVVFSVLPGSNTVTQSLEKIQLVHPSPPHLYTEFKTCKSNRSKWSEMNQTEQNQDPDGNAVGVSTWISSRSVTQARARVRQPCRDKMLGSLTGISCASLTMASRVESGCFCLGRDQDERREGD